MSEWFRWWLVIELLAVCGLPLSLVVFARLPDRGYTLSKAFALLVIGYAFWMLNSMHLLPNQRGGIIAAALLVALISVAVAWSRRDEMLEWWRRNWGYALAIEIAFVYVFALAVWLRSLVGQISGTEQPMDLMFLNAATQAKHFPPQDPWLSGNTVAYYYFGYLLIAMVGQAAGVAAEVGYNIGLGMIAALTMLGAFGIVYNLVRIREDAREGVVASAVQAEPAAKRSRRRVAVPAGGSADADGVAPLPPVFANFNWRPHVFGIAGALMLALMGNLAFLFKYMAGIGIGGDSFYKWLDIDGVTGAQQMDHGYPSEFFGFFGATRLYPINGDGFKAITEFPMFSFLLGDLHPHVMALPFVIAVVGLALSLFLSNEPLDLAFLVRRPILFAAMAVMLGALAFINTWDFVTFGFVIALAVLVRNWVLRPDAAPREPKKRDNSDRIVTAVVAVTHIGLAVLITAALRPAPIVGIALVGGAVAWTAIIDAYLDRGASWPAATETVVRTLSFLLPLTLLAVAAFIPFFDSFSSQAGGVLPVVTRPPGVTSSGSRPVQALIYWMPLFIVVVPFVVLRIIEQRERLDRRIVLTAAAVPVLILVAWAALFVLQVNIQDSTKLTGASSFSDQLIDRGSGWITYLLFGALLAGALIALYLEATAEREPARTAPLFALVLATTAFLLILGTEFFYIDDVFHVRMNTVFKLYYQAWVLLALAGGFALYQLASAWRVSFPHDRTYRYAWAGAAALAIAAAALYTIGGTMNRVRPYDASHNVTKPRAGLNGLADHPADELAAIAWLKGLAEDQEVVIAEAVGNDYTLAGRISAGTGAPAVLGWGGHEDQWRGSSAARAGRFEDISALYQGDMSQAQQIVSKYGITYIYVGDLERTTYGEAALDKFTSLPVAFQQGNVTVYRTTGEQAEAAPAQ